MLQTRSFEIVLAAQLIGFGICSAALSVPTPSYFAGFFDVRVRFSGISIGREAGSVIGGGLSPLIASALFAWVGATWPIALCMAATSLLGLGALLVAPDQPVVHLLADDLEGQKLHLLTPNVGGNQTRGVS